MERQWIDGVLFEAPVVAGHLGQAVAVPTLEGRSSTGLVRAARTTSPPGGRMPHSDTRGATIRELVVTAEGEPSWP